MPQPGFVYILVNPSANEFLKIGKTERDPEARAKELSSATGVPTPFYVAFQSYFQDCTRAEEYVHARLAQHRVASNREFFRVPLRQAIEAILEAEKILSEAISSIETSASVEQNDLAQNDPADDVEDMARDIYYHAEAYYHGFDDVLQDYEEALNLYKQAAKLGNYRAVWSIGRMYRNGKGCSVDLRLALQYLKEGTKGEPACWAEMADLYYSEGNLENSLKCWQKYFDDPRYFHSAHDATGKYGVEYYVARYFLQTCETNGELTHINKIRLVPPSSFPLGSPLRNLDIIHVWVVYPIVVSWERDLLVKMCRERGYSESYSRKVVQYFLGVLGLTEDLLNDSMKEQNSLMKGEAKLKDK